jgi:hypothetical protein
MNNSRAQFTPDTGERAKAVQQGIDQGSAVSVVVGSASSRVDHHSGRLIYHREIIIFINNVERDFFRHCAHWRSFGFADDFNLLASAELKGRPRRFPIDENLFLRDKLLDSRTAGVPELGDEEVIEAPAGMLWADNEICFGFHSQVTRCHSAVRGFRQ